MGNTRKIKPRDLAKAGMAKCIVPECGRPFKPDEAQLANPPKRPPVCPACMKMGIQLAWWLTHIRVERGRTAGGIITPGHKDYKPTLDGAPLEIAKR